MKKFLMLAVVAAFLGASVGCDDKKSSGSTPKPASGTTPAGGAGSKTS